jgi:hypothetical protein
VGQDEPGAHDPAGPVQGEHFVQAEASFDPLDLGAENVLKDEKHKAHERQEPAYIVQVAGKSTARRQRPGPGNHRHGHKEAHHGEQEPLFHFVHPFFLLISALSL